ncbi:MAG: transposase, partial [Actinomycetota bacterium]|nr:transposase [Actinomycetota bacterium]
RMVEAWPSARLVHLPVHASWLNQIEIVFSIIQRKVIKPADFADLDALGDRLRRFEDRYNESATPFDWRFSTADLTAMLERVDSSAGHEVALAA